MADNKNVKLEVTAIPSPEESYRIQIKLCQQQQGEIIEFIRRDYGFEAECLDGGYQLDPMGGKNINWLNAKGLYHLYKSVTRLNALQDVRNIYENLLKLEAKQ